MGTLDEMFLLHTPGLEKVDDFNSLQGSRPFETRIGVVKSQNERYCHKRLVNNPSPNGCGRLRPPTTQGPPESPPGPPEPYMKRALHVGAPYWDGTDGPYSDGTDWDGTDIPSHFGGRVVYQALVTIYKGTPKRGGPC